MRYERSCGAVVVRVCGGRRDYLIIRQNDGNWGLPKGHMEPGESEEQTALREVKEETGLTVTLDTAFRREVTYSPARGVTKKVIYFAAVEPRGTLRAQPEELACALWLGFRDAVLQVSHTNTAQIIREAESYFENNE